MTNQTILTGPSFKAAVERKVQESMNEVVGLYYDIILANQQEAIDLGNNYFCISIKLAHAGMMTTYFASLGFKMLYDSEESDYIGRYSITPSC